MNDKPKKGMTTVRAIIIYAVCLIVAAIIVVANVVTTRYEELITTFFQSSDYKITDAEKELCKQVEAEGIVLLKNKDNALPLRDNEKKVCLLGQNSVDFLYGGIGSGEVSGNMPTLKQAMESAGFTVNQTVWDFYEKGAGKNYRKQLPDSSGKGSFAVNEVPASVYTDAVKESMNDNVGIVTIGRSGGESADLPLGKLASGYGYLEIDKDERDLLKLACEKFDKVVLIVNSSIAMELGFLEDPAFANVKAALTVGCVGQEGIYAVADVLAGKVNPSGKLVDTYAYDSTSAPSFANMGNFTLTGSSEFRGDKYLVYAENIYVGYKYYETRYEDSVLDRGNAGDFDYEATVQYPFGYGLSYSEFTWSGFSMTEKEDGFEISVKVKNTKGAAGKDVVQIYMQSPYTPYDKENKIEKSSVELVGFAKTSELAPGAEETVTVTVDKESMKAYDSTAAKTYIVDEGTYYFTAATDAHKAINNILAAKRAEIDGAGDADMVGCYVQAEFDATTYAKSDAVENSAITNRFDDVSINYYDRDFAYLSRNDWAGTLPAGAYKGGAWAAPAQLIEDLKFYRADEVVNDPDVKMPQFGSTATAYTAAEMIGVAYNDKKWDDMISQISFKRMTELVRLGGYATKQIDAIGLPRTTSKDGPAGFTGTLVGGVNTMAWPTEVVFACTWNVDLIEEVGKMIGEESIAAGIAGWYAPGVNIHRSPYSGRNFEYFSEDGFLSGKMGAAEIRGARSKGVIPYMKHFALNDQETNRYGCAVFASEQAIREIYLKGFELTVTEGGCNAAMASMNRLGARWAGAHKGLMTDVLRNEWGFKGMVITDQASFSAMSYQDIVSGLWAGTDIWLCTDSTLWSLDEYKKNPTVMSHVHRAAKNIVYAVTHSNAVDTRYGTSGTDFGTPPWIIVRTVLTCVLGVAVAVGVGLTTFFLLRKRHNKKKENKIP